MRGFLRKHQKGLLFAILLVLCIGLTTTVFRVYAADDENLDMSFYKMSSAATTYMESVLGSNDGVKKADGVSVGNAGGFLGYCDEADSDGLITGVLMSSLSSSSAEYAYDAFANIPVGGTGSTDAMYRYCRYGYTLASLGLDKTGLQATSGFSFRGIVAVLFQFMYLLCAATPALFKAILGILKTFNPFALFGGAIGTLGNVGTADVVAPGSPWSGLADWLSGLYQDLQSVSLMIVIPISLLAVVIALMLGDRSKRLPKVKRFCMRLFLIVVGVPLCGALYSTALNGMSDFVASGNGGATRVIASTFIDFESWAKNMRLAVPSGVSIWSNADANSGGVPSSLTQMRLRNTCYLINRASGAIPGTMGDLFGNGTYTGSASNMADFDNQIWNDRADTSQYDTNSGMELNEFQSVMNMLSRYGSSEFYFAGDWETYVKSAMVQASANNSAFHDGVLAMVRQSDSPADFKDDSVSQFESPSDWTVNPWTNGGLTAVSTNPDQDVTEATLRYGDTQTNPGYLAASDFNTKQGLSTMALYNYLTTSFNKSGMLVYSNKKASSGLVRESHYAVNIIGDGMISILYGSNCLVMLTALAVIGIFYGCSIMFTNLRRSIRLISAIPMAMLGSIRSMAKVVVYTVLLILETLGTMFVYALVSEMLVGFSGIIEKPLAAGLSSGIFGGIVTSSLSLVLSIIMLLLNLILTVWFTFMALRMRKAVVGSFEKAGEELVNKFMDTTGVHEMPKQPGLIQKAGDAVGRGVGMAAGATLMGAAHDKLVTKDAVAGTSTRTDSGSGGNGGGDSSGPSGSGGDGGAAIADGGSAPGIGMSGYGSNDTGHGSGSGMDGSSGVRRIGQGGSYSGNGIQDSAHMDSDDANLQSDMTSGQLLLECKSLDDASTKDGSDAADNGSSEPSGHAPDEKASETDGHDAAVRGVSASDGADNARVPEKERQAEGRKELEREAKKEVAKEGTKAAVDAGKAAVKGVSGDMSAMKDAAHAVGHAKQAGDAAKSVKGVRAESTESKRNVSGSKADSSTGSKSSAGFGAKMVLSDMSGNKASAVRTRGVKSDTNNRNGSDNVGSGVNRTGSSGGDRASVRPATRRTVGANVADNAASGSSSGYSDMSSGISGHGIEPASTEHAPRPKSLTVPGSETVSGSQTERSTRQSLNDGPARTRNVTPSRETVRPEPENAQETTRKRTVRERVADTAGKIAENPTVQNVAGNPVVRASAASEMYRQVQAPKKEKKDTRPDIFGFDEPKKK